jgi:DNA adenine methylase
MAYGYYGGKRQFCTEITGLLDYSTTVYVEAFGGGASVLLNKAPHNKEIYIEKSLTLCCFWHCMSENETACKLIERLYDTDYDRTAFEHFRNAIDEVEAIGKHLSDMPVSYILEIATACFVVYSISRDNAGLRFSSQVKGHEAYLKSVDRLIEVANRFNGVEVTHGDALDLLYDDMFNDCNVMLYLDPVYLPEAGRKNSHNHTLYRYNFGYEEHVKLLERIRNMNARIVISGYADDRRTYDRYLIDGEGFTGSFKSWNRYEIDAISAVARGDNKRTEILWVNYA